MAHENQRRTVNANRREIRSNIAVASEAEEKSEVKFPSVQPAKHLAAKKIICDYLKSRRWKVFEGSAGCAGFALPLGWVDVLAKKAEKRIGVQVEIGGYRYVGSSSSISRAGGGLVSRLISRAWVFDEVWLAFEEGCKLSDEIPNAVDACAIRLFTIDFKKEKLNPAHLISTANTEFRVIGGQLRT